MAFMRSLWQKTLKLNFRSWIPAVWEGSFRSSNAGSQAFQESLQALAAAMSHAANCVLWQALVSLADCVGRDLHWLSVDFQKAFCWGKWELGRREVSSEGPDAVLMAAADFMEASIHQNESTEGLPAVAKAHLDGGIQPQRFENDTMPWHLIFVNCIEELGVRELNPTDFEESTLPFLKKKDHADAFDSNVARFNKWVERRGAPAGPGPSRGVEARARWHGSEPSEDDEEQKRRGESPQGRKLLDRLEGLRKELRKAERQAADYQEKKRKERKSRTPPKKKAKRKERRSRSRRRDPSKSPQRRSRSRKKRSRSKKRRSSKRERSPSGKKKRRRKQGTGSEDSGRRSSSTEKEELLSHSAEARTLAPATKDEIFLVLALTPLLRMNLRAVVDGEVTITDASPMGAGGGVSSAFKRAPDTVEHAGEECYYCQRVLTGPKYPCPAECNAVMCSLECMWRHRGMSCKRRSYPVPKFGERTSEMLALQGCHLLPHHSKPEVAIVIPFSKTSNGNAQVLMVKDYNIWRLTRHVTRQRPSATLLWPGTPAQFRALWGQILLCLDFRSDDYTPYGIRRGGATWFFLETASLDATLARGRWSVSKTARSYVDDGTLTLARQHWSVAQRRNVRWWMRRNRLQWAHLGRF
eukprot:s9_g61.t1